MAGPYHTRTADLPRQEAEVTALWSVNLFGLKSAGARLKLQQGYLDNPSGQGMAVLLHEASHQAPVGVIGLHPRRGEYLGQAVPMANLSDFAVAPEHRSLGPALMLVRAAVAASAQRYALLWGLPNRKSAGVMKRAGLERVGNLSRHTKVLRAGALRGRKAVVRGLLAAVAPAVDLVLLLADGLRRAWAGENLRAMEIPWDDPRLDSLWAQRPREWLLAERSGEQLRWRFAPPRPGGWSIALLEDRAGQACGYFIWRIRGHGAAELGDFFAQGPQPPCAELLLAAGRFLRSKGASTATLSFFGTPAVGRALHQAGFRVRSTERGVFVARSPMSGAELASRWYVTSFDEDAD